MLKNNLFRNIKSHSKSDDRLDFYDSKAKWTYQVLRGLLISFIIVKLNFKNLPLFKNVQFTTFFYTIMISTIIANTINFVTFILPHFNKKIPKYMYIIGGLLSNALIIIYIFLLIQLASHTN